MSALSPKSFGAPGGGMSVGSGSPDGSINAAVGQIYADTATGVIWRNTTGSTIWEPVTIPPNAGFYLVDDLMNNGFAMSFSPIGGGTQGQSNGETSRPGLWTATVSAAGVDGVVGRWETSLSSVVLGGGPAKSKASLRIATLSDGVNNVIVRACMGDLGTSIGDVTDGAYLEYDFAVHANHNWWLCTANNSTRTKADTGIAAVASAAACQCLSVAVNALGTSVTATVDGVASAAVNTTNIPAGAGRVFSPCDVYIAKQLGAGPLSVTTDWVLAYQVLTAPRTN